MQEDNKFPAITIPDKGLSYFNEWKCFGSDEVQIVAGEVEYFSKPHVVPGLFVKNKKLQFDLDHDVKWDLKRIKKAWQNLLEDTNSICIFAVYLQKMDSNELWFIDKIKSSRGVWDRVDDSFVLEE